MLPGGDRGGRPASWGPSGALVGLGLVLLLVFALTAASMAAPVGNGRPKKPAPTPTSTPMLSPPPSGDPVLVGAGDIASCSGAGDEATAKLLDGIAGTVYTLGDNVYDNGTATEFANCYEPSWGRHKARTRPAPVRRPCRAGGGPAAGLRADHGDRGAAAAREWAAQGAHPHAARYADSFPTADRRSGPGGCGRHCLLQWRGRRRDGEAPRRHRRHGLHAG